MIGNALGGLKAIVAGRISRMARARVQIAALYAVILFLLLIAFVAALVAAGIALADEVGAIAACLWIAGAAVVLALILLVIVMARTKAARDRERRDAALQKQALAAILTTVSILRPRNSLLLAVAAGIVAGLIGLPSRRDKD